MCLKRLRAFSDDQLAADGGNLSTQQTLVIDGKAAVVGKNNAFRFLEFGVRLETEARLRLFGIVFLGRTW